MKHKAGGEKTGALIVAAGLSSRMKAFKPMLPLAGATVIRTLIRTLRSSGADPIVVVTGRNSEELSEHIADLQVETVCNAEYATTDMFRSACIGFARLQGRCDRLFFMPGDVPLFSRYSLLALLEYMDQQPCDILIPSYNGQKGHPVLLKEAALPALMSYAGEGGLKGAINAFPGKKELLELPDQGLIMDADTPRDYACLQKYAQSRAEAPALHGEISLSLGRSDVFFDETLAELLLQTRRTGSLAMACKQAGISYSNGWKRIKNAQDQLGFLLIRSVRGGSSGGSSHLTASGSAFLEAYSKLRKSIQKYSQKQFEKYFGEEL